MWTWLVKSVLPKISPLAEAQNRYYETEITLLKAKHEKVVEKLEAKNRDLGSEIDRLKQELNEGPKSTHLDRPEIQTRILLFIAQHEQGEIGSETNEIAHRVSVAKEAIPFHLHELEAADFIESSDKYAVPMWHMKHEGRRYLIERDLIK